MYDLRKKLSSLIFVLFSFTGLYLFRVSEIGMFHTGITIFKLVSMPTLVYLNFFFGFRTLRNITKFLIYFFLFLIMAALNFSNLRFSSIMNIVFFFLVFLLMINIFSNQKKVFIANNYKIIIDIYFYTTILGLVFYLLRFNFLDFTYTFELRKSVFPRFQGFSTEPSHASFIIVVSFVSYFMIAENRNRIWATFFKVLLLIILFQSAYGILLMFIVIPFILSKTLNLNKGTFIVFYSFMLILLFYFIRAYFIRLTGIYDFIISGDITKMDPSASVRIKPLLYTLKYYHYNSFWSMLFGNGAGSSTYYIMKIMPTTKSGHITSYFYDFGLFGLFWLFYLFIIVTPQKNRFFYFIFSGLLILNSNIGTQIFWYVIFNFYLIKLNEKSITKKSKHVERKIFIEAK